MTYIQSITIKWVGCDIIQARLVVYETIKGIQVNKHTPFGYKHVHIYTYIQ